MSEENKLIDNWCKSLLEYPFVRVDGTMTKKEYFKELEYYKSHIKDIADGTYKPLWKQKEV